MEKINPPASHSAALPADSEQFLYTKTRIQATQKKHLQETGS